MTNPYQLYIASIQEQILKNLQRINVLLNYDLKAATRITQKLVDISRLKMKEIKHLPVCLVLK